MLISLFFLVGLILLSNPNASSYYYFSTLNFYTNTGWSKLKGACLPNHEVSGLNLMDGKNFVRRVFRRKGSDPTRTRLVAWDLNNGQEEGDFEAKTYTRVSVIG